MKKATATTLGFLAASAIPPLAGALITPISGRFDAASLTFAAVALYPFSAAATILFGVPTFLLLRKFGLINWWSALASGFVIGALVATALWLPRPVDPQSVLTMGPIGAIAAFAFWMIWRRGHDPANADAASATHV